MPISQGVAVHLHLQREYRSYALMEYPSLDLAINDGDDSINSKEARTATVFTPLFPASKFWISYQINTDEVISTFFYFKLIIDGRHIVSWGTGDNESYRGVTKHALYTSDLASENRTPDAAERSFVFPTFPAAGCIEVQVYRSNARRRRRRANGLEHYKDFGLVKGKGPSLSLCHAGYNTDDKHPKFYEYALVDPPTEAWVKFRFLYRSMEALFDLGLVKRRSSSRPSINSSTLNGPTSHRSASDIDDDQSPLNGPGKFFEQPAAIERICGSAINLPEMAPITRIHDNLDCRNEISIYSSEQPAAILSRSDIRQRLTANKVRRFELLLGSHTRGSIGSIGREIDKANQEDTKDKRTRGGAKRFKAIIAGATGRSR